MEFLDEETRPRFLFQSRSFPPQISETRTKRISKLSLFISLSASLSIFLLTFLTFNYEPLQSLLIWLALSLLLGPFAPPSLTAGDIGVGRGLIVQFPSDEGQPVVEENSKLTKAKSTKLAKADIKFRRSGELSTGFTPSPEGRKDNDVTTKEVKNEAIYRCDVKEEREWSEEDLQVLKKQMAKHPVGEPSRWETIAEAFKGGHKVESVIKMAKLTAEKKSSDDNSYERFLKNRKPLDMRIDGDGEDLAGRVVHNGELKKEKEGLLWIPEEDLALLNALKAFPKDVAMRWEKISAAIPGKSKSECIKRLAELKRDFRNSKVASDR